MRLLICAGGTGGGVYPALAVLETMLHNHSAHLDQTLWVGVQGGMEADLVKRLKIPYTEIPAAGVHGVGWRSLPGNLLRLLRGFFASRTILNRFRPHVLFFTGGYVAVPMAMAATFSSPGGSHPPSLLYVPDIEPGLALKTLARFAQRIAVTHESSRSFLPTHADVVVSGYPLRPDLKKWEKDEARRVFNLESDIPVLLVFGGSKGARSINQALLAALPELLNEAQIIHISGYLDWEGVQAALQTLQRNFPEKANRYYPFPYLHEKMGAALAAADLAISRAGASTLGEFPYFGLPAVLVPYPYAWKYQQVNAQYLEQHGAALIVEDKDLPQKLPALVKSLLNDKSRLEKMRQAMLSLAISGAAEIIADAINDLAGQGQRKGMIDG